VGKSTLVNLICGDEAQRVGDVRDFDRKGRHTTVHRQLVPTPSGAVVMDTPGLRELQVWEVWEGLERAFADLDELATQCRFSNCTHSGEPGCMLRVAEQDGRLPPGRVDNYLKLQREAEVAGARQDVMEAARLKRTQKRAVRSYETLQRSRGPR
jgi:ribosome biogenesis GTPase